LFSTTGSEKVGLRDRSKMIAAILFTVSLAAFGQFALFYWRAMLAGVAAQPVSDRVLAAAGISSHALGAQDFRSILSLHELAPELGGPGGSFRAVRTYYTAVQKLGRLIPAMANWANAEMATCSRYLAVLVDQHLERNLVCAAQVRGL
jgi:hypothetical protein